MTERWRVGERTSRVSRRVLPVGLALVLAASAAPADDDDEHDRPEAAARFTLGVVQKELRAGLSQADVAERLGSPNIVTRGAEGREAWVYDKVSSERETSSASAGVGGLGSGSGSSFFGLLGVGVGKRSEKSRSSQRTLTVVIRFSADGTVEGFTWHSSRF